MENCIRVANYNPKAKKYVFKCGEHHVHEDYIPYIKFLCEEEELKFEKREKLKKHIYIHEYCKDFFDDGIWDDEYYDESDKYEEYVISWE